MTKDSQIFVGHILTEIEILHKLSARNTILTLFENDIDYRAAIYSIQCISEAVRSLPPHWTAEFPTFPWQDIKAIGNWTTHQYYGLDHELIWKVMTEDLIPFQEVVQKLQHRG